MSAASVLTWTTRPTVAARQARRTLRVPSTFAATNSGQGPKSSTLAAAWKQTSAPAIPVTSAGRSSSCPRTGSAPRVRTASAARSERASAGTDHPPRARRSIRRPPTKPDPPVAEAGGLGRPPRAGIAPGPARPLSPTARRLWRAQGALAALGALVLALLGRAQLPGGWL